MKIAIFGANGPTGRLLTRQALAEGHSVTAITRHPDQFPLEHEDLRVMSGDVYHRESVENAVAGQEAVLSTLGVPFSRKPITVYSQGIGHILHAMNRFGVRRLLCVSSSATEPHVDPEGGFFFERIVQPMITNTIGKTLYEDMRRMEEIVRNSDLDWTIIRPSGLFETPEVTPYQTAENHIRGRFTSRADLANCMLRQLTSDRYLRKTAAVATVEVQPSMLKLIMREAFQSKHK
ncbi:NAD(P)-dependent oxidoreductase [Paenibacillus sacheonensis]|uniref:NAD(P)H-binding protein n=1 Tax=Paenibacillus sacheonensis TaxID=742054 RepID=A0A7X4YQB3_9BACL|nr:SDR family oxidoreductase [Paenibacillus sacheonensis]MBM7566321.1 putative NADH-flavin reductase [Paenibacillus sacheonensis]NBC70525.1 NAD(P)H-binding protein [Paenibacillus sacheonensis]